MLVSFILGLWLGIPQTALTLIGAGGPPSGPPTPVITCCSSVGSGNAISGTTATTGTAGTAFSCGSGNTEVAWAYDGGIAGGTISMADSASNSGWTNYGAKDTSGNTFQEQIWVNFNIASSVTSVTATFSGTPSFYGVSAVCLSGPSNIDFARVTANGGFNTAVAGGSYSTSHATEISISFIGMSGQTTITPVVGYTALGAGFTPTIDGILGIYQIFSATQSGISASGTLAASENWKIVTIGLY